MSLLQRILQSDFTQNTDNEWISPDSVGDQRRDLRSGGYYDLNGTDNAITYTGTEIGDIATLEILYDSGSGWTTWTTGDTAVAGLYELSGTTLTIGNDGTNYFTGGVALVKGYDASSDVVFFAKCDEASGTTSYDSSGNGNHGTIGGALTGFHNTDISLRSWHNEVGYNLSGSTYIPRLATAANLALDPASQTDVLGSTLTYYGRAKYDGLLKSGCLVTNGTDNLVIDSDIISIGAADFYFRLIVTADVNPTAGYYLRTGDTGSSGTLSIYRYSSGDVRLFMGKQDGTYAATPLLFASGEYSDGDLLEFVFSRTGTDFSYTATNHTTGLVNTGSLTRNEDFSPSGNLTLASASTATTYYVLQIGTSSSSLSHEYTFGEGDGAINYDRVGTNHLTWGGALGSLWTTSEYQEPYNNKNGFDRWNTASDGSGTDLFVPLQSDGTSIKGSGDTITGYTWQEKVSGSDKYHNGSEMEIYQPSSCPQLYDIDQNDFTTAIWYDAAGVPQAVGWGDLVDDYGSDGFWWTETWDGRRREWLVFDAAMSGPVHCAGGYMASASGYVAGATSAVAYVAGIASASATDVDA